MNKDPRIEIPNMMPQMQISTQQLLNQLMRMQQYLQRLDQNMVMVSVELMTSRAHTQMLQDLLMAKNVCTQEEIEQLYKAQVEEPMKQYIEELNTRRQQAMNAVQQQPEEPQEEKTPGVISLEETEEEEESDSDVVLPSERHKAVKFK